LKEQFFKRLLDNANDLIWSIDMEGCFTYINDNIKDWGYDKDELIGKPLLNILNTQHIIKRDHKTFGADTKEIYEMETLDKYGKIHRVIVSSSPLKDDDGVIVGVMGIIRDVTENQKLQERLKTEEQLASLGRLAIGIAHEIRNPLSSVKMNLSILKSRLNPKEDDLTHFNIAQDEVFHLEKIVTELLDYAKPAPLDLHRHNPHNVIEETISLLSPPGSTDDFAIKKSFISKVPMILMDKGKIHQALLNILINAIQASKPGGIIEIKTELVEPANDKFRITVKDNGDGVSPEDAKYVFDPFFTKKAKGTGLGLSIVRNIMNNHNGDVRLESTPGKGVSVYLELPVS